MSRSIQVVIAPSPQSARILVTEGPERTLLKAQLGPQTGHPRALPWLLEALALWEGTTVHAVLAVDEWDASSANTLYRDAFADSGTPPLYSLNWIPLAHVRRRRRSLTAPSGLGDFRDLRRVQIEGANR